MASQQFLLSSSLSFLFLAPSMFEEALLLASTLDILAGASIESAMVSALSS